MTEFQIKKGLLSSLMNDQGVCVLPLDKRIDGCWYLTTDTTELFIGRGTPEKFELKPLSSSSADIPEVVDSKVSFVASIEDLPSIDPDKETIYVVNNENASYRWTGTTYVCMGRDYNEIKIIDGGTAHIAK